MTIDRPYGKIFDFLHHRIGSTHVVHHIDCTIPHYRAKAATEAIKETFPDHYLYDPTPLPEVCIPRLMHLVHVSARTRTHSDPATLPRGLGTSPSLLQRPQVCAFVVSGYHACQRSCIHRFFGGCRRNAWPWRSATTSGSLFRATVSRSCPPAPKHNTVAQGQHSAEEREGGQRDRERKSSLH